MQITLTKEQVREAFGELRFMGADACYHYDRENKKKTEEVEALKLHLGSMKLGNSVDIRLEATELPKIEPYAVVELEQQITNLREELSKMEQDMIGAERWIELIKEYSVPKELTAPLLNAMIEKILIHEATTNEENERIQEIEIYYRFIGKVD